MNATWCGCGRIIVWARRFASIACKRRRSRAGQLFLDYLRRANELHERAEWYNALTDNCTTAIRTQRAAADRAPWNWRMLLNGHLDELLYERGAIVTNLPFAELKKIVQHQCTSQSSGPGG